MIDPFDCNRPDVLAGSILRQVGITNYTVYRNAGHHGLSVRCVIGKRMKVVETTIEPGPGSVKALADWAIKELASCE